MPYATNAIDEHQIYFEDNGAGVPVIFHGGFLDSVDLVRRSPLAGALQTRSDEFRVVYVDHRGHGLSDKPHRPEAYAMHLRVADALAVIDELGIQRAHFIGLSWGWEARLRYRRARSRTRVLACSDWTAAVSHLP